MLLRWQNDQGMRQRQELTAITVNHDGKVQLNSDLFSKWLLGSGQSGNTIGERLDNEKFLGIALAASDSRLDAVSNKFLHPENRQLVSVAWIDSRN